MNAMTLKERAKKLKAEIPAVFLSLKDTKTPAAAKVFAALTIAYALSPIDLIPDFIPVLGYLDDLVVLPLLISLTVRCIPPATMAECRAEGRALWQNGRPRRWQAAIPIVLLWLAALYLLARALFSDFLRRLS